MSQFVLIFVSFFVCSTLREINKQVAYRERHKDIDIDMWGGGSERDEEDNKEEE